jgi:hypothetical protein
MGAQNCYPDQKDRGRQAPRDGYSEESGPAASKVAKPPRYRDKPVSVVVVKWV